jgi:hypothetical protein
MYKGTSQSLQKKHAVDKPHPSRGYIDGPSDARDVLPPPDALGNAELRAERNQLRIEMARIEQELAVAKAVNNGPAIAAIGQRKMVHQTRLSAVNKVFHERHRNVEHAILSQAVNEVCDEAMCAAIFARCREIKDAESADSGKAIA